MVHCVIHSPDEHPSLHLTPNGDQVLAKCFTGCDQEAVADELVRRGFELTRKEEQKPLSITAHRQRKRDGKLVKGYRYRDEEGLHVADKARWEGASEKWFTWRKPGIEGWLKESGLKMRDMPLYGAERLKGTTGPVYLVEGEQCAEACWEVGLMAVSLAGGAAQKDFGEALGPLKGRDVILWPDNDGQGRMLMNLLEAKLEGAAKSVSYVSLAVALPEKGDACDYFSGGGKSEDLAALRPHEPTVEFMGQDSIRVTVVAPGDVPVTFDFSEMEKSRRDLNTHLTMTFPGMGRYPYSQRLNIDSFGGRQDLRRDFDNLYGPPGEDKNGWLKVITTACSIARQSFLHQDRGVRASDIPEGLGELYLIPPLMPLNGVTIIFGDGGVSKSYLALMLALAACNGTTAAGRFETPNSKVIYIDYEDSAINFRRRCKRVMAGTGFDPIPSDIIYWAANGIPFKDQWEPIKSKIEAEGINWMIVDSAAPACGGPPEESSSAIEFDNAIKRIGIPTLLIAHQTKSGDGNTLKPFGSTFWHNLARRTWHVEREQQEESDEVDVWLRCRKVNDGRKPKPICLRITFEDEDGAVTFQEGDADHVEKFRTQTSAQHQVWVALETPMTIKDIAEETGLTSRCVDTTLRRHSDMFASQGKKETGTSGRSPLLWGRVKSRVESTGAESNRDSTQGYNELAL
jgi:hypothetical protein